MSSKDVLDLLMGMMCFGIPIIGIIMIKILDQVKEDHGQEAADYLLPFLMFPIIFLMGGFAVAGLFLMILPSHLEPKFSSGGDVIAFGISVSAALHGILLLGIKQIMKYESLDDANTRGMYHYFLLFSIINILSLIITLVVVFMPGLASVIPEFIRCDHTWHIQLYTSITEAFGLTNPIIEWILCITNTVIVIIYNFISRDI